MKGFLDKTDTNRLAIGELLHKRIFPLVCTPCRVIQYLITFDAVHERELEKQLLGKLAEKYSSATFSCGSQSLQLEFQGVILRWERHTEFSTYSFIEYEGIDQLFIAPAKHPTVKFVIDQVPGSVFRVSQVVAIKRDTGNTSKYMRFFDALSCVRSKAKNGLAEIWTDFRLHAEGSGRSLILDFGLHPHSVGRLIQQLLDVGNYRRMSLLGWPIAQQSLSDLTRLEQAHLKVIRGLKHSEKNDQKLLLDLAEVSAGTEALIAKNSARLHASIAYYQLTLDRSNAIDETPINGFFTLRDFTDRRLKPAVRTAESVLDRQKMLSDRLGRSFDLLRTRCDLKLESQNQRLLKSIDRNGRAQVNLQRTVEFVSVVAISYYLLDMIYYALVGLQRIWPQIDPSIGKLAAFPVIIILFFGVFFALFKRKS